MAVHSVLYGDILTRLGNMVCGRRYVNTALPPVLANTFVSKPSKPHTNSTLFIGIKYVRFLEADPNGTHKGRKCFRPCTKVDKTQ